MTSIAFVADFDRWVSGVGKCVRCLEVERVSVLTYAAAAVGEIVFDLRSTIDKKSRSI